jgi:hypothetical protein
MLGKDTKINLTEWISNVTEKVTHLVPRISYFALRVLLWLGKEAKMDVEEIINVKAFYREKSKRSLPVRSSRSKS